MLLGERGEAMGLPNEVGPEFELEQVPELSPWRCNQYPDTGAAQMSKRRGNNCRCAARNGLGRSIVFDNKALRPSQYYYIYRTIGP
jgi:hypothetical protein